MKVNVARLEADEVSAPNIGWTEWLRICCLLEAFGVRDSARRMHHSCLRKV